MRENVQILALFYLRGEIQTPAGEGPKLRHVNFAKVWPHPPPPFFPVIFPPIQDQKPGNGSAWNVQPVGGPRAPWRTVDKDRSEESEILQIWRRPSHSTFELLLCAFTIVISIERWKCTVSSTKLDFLMIHIEHITYQIAINKFRSLVWSTDPYWPVLLPPARVSATLVKDVSKARFLNLILSWGAFRPSSHPGYGWIAEFKWARKLAERHT